MHRGGTDPGQVLHLIDDVDAVGAGPDAVVDGDLEEVERHDPERQHAERDEEAGFDRIEPAGSGGNIEQRLSALETAQISSKATPSALAAITQR